jgi:hypothetical protein
MTEAAPRAVLGAYYFEGWSEDNDFHLSSSLRNDYPEREPIWGWLNDSLRHMELQIDLAADNGISYFAFCWYWDDANGPINEPAIMNNRINSGVARFLEAENNNRMQFCFLVANHAGFEITGTENWKSAADFWMPYFQHPQYLKTEGKPLLIIFDRNEADSAGFDYMQQAAVEAGLPGVAAAVNWSGDENLFGYVTQYNSCNGWGQGQIEKSYAELTECTEATWTGHGSQAYIPIIMAGWDNRPWPFEPDSWYYTARTPEQLGAHVENAITWMDENPDLVTPEHIAIIYAWNEYGEGGYLVPNGEDPDGEYLKAIKEVVDPITPVSPPPPAVQADNSQVFYNLGGRLVNRPQQNGVYFLRTIRDGETTVRRVVVR